MRYILLSPSITSVWESSYLYIFFQWENGRGSIPCSIRPVLWRGSCPAQMAGNHRLIVHLQQVQHLVPPLPLLQRNLQRGTVHREQTWKTMENKYCLVKNGISGSWIVIISNRKGSNSMTYDRKKNINQINQQGFEHCPIVFRDRQSQTSPTQNKIKKSWRESSELASFLKLPKSPNQWVRWPAAGQSLSFDSFGAPRIFLVPPKLRSQHDLPTGNMKASWNGGTSKSSIFFSVYKPSITIQLLGIPDLWNSHEPSFKRCSVRSLEPTSAKLRTAVLSAQPYLAVLRPQRYIVDLAKFSNWDPLSPRHDLRSSCPRLHPPNHSHNVPWRCQGKTWPHKMGSNIEHFLNSENAAKEHHQPGLLLSMTFLWFLWLCVNYWRFLAWGIPKSPWLFQY